MHLLIKCPAFTFERNNLKKKILKLTKHHFNYLGNAFVESLAGDGINASAILLGCDQIEYDGIHSKVKSLYRNLGKDSKTPNGIKKIVIHAADYIHGIFDKHGLLEN